MEEIGANLPGYLTNLPDEFMYKVKDFHENLGDKWLLVFDKYQKEVNTNSSPDNKGASDISPLEIRRVRHVCVYACNGSN